MLFGIRNKKNGFLAIGEAKISTIWNWTFGMSCYRFNKEYIPMCKTYMIKWEEKRDRELEKTSKAIQTDRSEI